MLQLKRETEYVKLYVEASWSYPIIMHLNEFSYIMLF